MCVHSDFPVITINIFRAAEALGLKETVPPYLDPALSNQDIVTGVSFASAGSGYDNLTASLTV